MARRSRSSLALFCLALRKARGLTQEDLAASAGVHVATVKNAEGDRPLAVATLGELYRDGLKGRHALSQAEWHQLLGFWLLRQFPGGVDLAALAGAVQDTGAKDAAALDARVQCVAAAFARLEPADAQLIADFAKLATGRRGAALLAALRAIVAL